jgi:hypothetical protein
VQQRIFATNVVVAGASACRRALGIDVLTQPAQDVV